MQIDIISVIPELLRSPFEHSIMKRAHEKGLLTVNLIDLRNYGVGNYRQIDDYQFGGGAGMVLMVEPLVRCIEERKSKTNYDEIIYLTPDGATLNQRICNSLSLKQNLLIICGHYKGIDQRVRDHWITMEISVGDYVLSGGELGAAILVDSIGRLIPGVLNDETSALTDSFQEFRELKVPEILLSGHQEKIDQWRFEESLKKTQERRPDLIRE